jgi:8-oxo-dGTP pyrophosphatase MutT (NUDIX family)
MADSVASVPFFDGVLLKPEEVDWETEDFASVAVYLSCFVSGKLCLIFGKNAKYGNLSAFGGLPEKGEKLRVTCRREFCEEILYAISDDWMFLALNGRNGRVWKRPGNRYVCHAILSGNFLGFCETRNEFLRYKKEHEENLTKGEQENGDLIAVPLEAIKESVSENTDMKNWMVTELDGATKHKLRDVCIATSLMLAAE